ncbi:hypothetical protein [Neolewinella persica]|uniref:hypothetical protein n=1 Tax=Neolewinella persica TaxID=70998 RepID=UPI0003A1F1D7|nr:hypothetical protein [Neolewinella persica]
MSQPIYTNIAPLSSYERLMPITDLAVQRGQRADVVLGMPSQDCRFHGICRVEKYGEVSVSKRQACKGETVNGWLLRPQPNHCVLLIERGRLSAEREKYHFARCEIEVRQPVDVSSFFAKNGGKKFLLRKGVYALQFTKNYYTILMPLTNKV